jgi:hypothetical protein
MFVMKSQRARAEKTWSTRPAPNRNFPSEARNLDGQPLDLDPELGERRDHPGRLVNAGRKRDLPGPSARLQLGREVDRVPEIINLGIEPNGNARAAVDRNPHTNVEILAVASKPGLNRVRRPDRGGRIVCMPTASWTSAAR